MREARVKTYLSATTDVQALQSRRQARTDFGNEIARKFSESTGLLHRAGSYIGPKASKHMKTYLSIVSVCCAAGLLTAGILLSATLQSNRHLRESTQKVEAELRNARTTTETLQAANRELIRQLEVFRTLTETLQSRVADFEAAPPAESETAGSPPAVSPFRAQAYVGKSPLGWAWIVPHNVRKDPKSQRYVYDPVVWLEEGLRGRFTTHHTNVVEREVQTQSYPPTTYYPEVVYSGYTTWPVYPSPPIHRPPGMTNPPPIVTPPTPIQPVPQPFNPGSGSITVQQLGTPAAAIKTRPVP